MPKLFISQPMKDKTNIEIKIERERAVFEVTTSTSTKYEVIDSFFENAQHDATPLWYLGEAIKLLGTADVVYFCKNWEKYRGCVIEHECAVRYGIKCMYA